MTGRMLLALLVVVPAGMAYPWQTNLDWWLLGIAAVVVVVVFAWWRGTFLTTMLRRRLGLLRNRSTSRRSARQPVQHSETDAHTTVVLRVLTDDEHEVPLATLAGYLDRYGVRCDAVRVTRRDTGEGRTTWIGLTLSAAANLTALQARSENIPLRETAEVTLRRLADHLRELGYTISTVDVDVPDLLGPDCKEGWRSVQDGNHGYVTCYAVPADGGLLQTLDEIRTAATTEVWTAVELSGAPAHPAVTAACAVRTEAPPAAAPLPELVPLRGRQRTTLSALHPESTARLAV